MLQYPGGLIAALDQVATMFLAKDRRFGVEQYVFTQIDPRKDGFEGEVTDGVELDYESGDIYSWPDGEDRPNLVLGRDPVNPKHYKVFKYPKSLQKSGFDRVHFNAPLIAHDWSDYRKLYYPPPEQYAQSMTQDEWFEFLEEADSAAKIRKTLNSIPDPAPGATREQVAEWIARGQMAADGAIQRIWYLNAGSPPDEIRLIAINDRYLGEPEKLEPFTFYSEIAGRQFRVAIVDATSNQLERIRGDAEAGLPSDWNFGDATSWDRRGRTR